MVQYKRVEKLLEFDKIKKMLLEKARSPMAKELISSLSPTDDVDEILRSQEETQEGVTLLKSDVGVSLGGIRDIRDSLYRARLGAMLTPKELLDICSCMRNSGSIHRLWQEKAIDGLEIINAIVNCLHMFSSLVEKIDKTIVSEDEIADDASPKLLSLRRGRKSLSQNIRDKLNGIISSPQFQKILQEPIVTTRKNRFVVPVKLEYRGSLDGVIHDQSASGSTIYVEPMAVVNMNNELRRIESEETREIERILWELSEKIRENHDFIVITLKALTELDFILAKAEYSLDICGVRPRINSDGIIHIIQGRHPLLKGHVVPVDISLGEDYSILVVTGPNTGGKTVSLKTLGLFTLMALSGLQLPAQEGTELSTFDGIYADIGDEQSIEQSLSTFSSHMRNICNIVEEASRRSLVLLDELGSGTDPTEGSALAMALLDHFHEKGTRVMATTHYSELKSYAYSKPGVENASVEFDIETLSPTFRLTIGLPGKSNAFEISERLGLTTDIIKAAREYVSDDSLKLEEMLKHIETERIRAEQDRDELGSLKRDYRNRFEELETERERIQQHRDRILERAREESLNLIERLERESTLLMRQLKEAAKSKGLEDQDRAIENAREWLRGAKADIEGPEEKSLIGTHSIESQGPLKIGDDVEISGIGQRGQILKLDAEAESAQVQVGMMKINVPTNSLLKTTVDDDGQKSKYASIGLEKLKSFSKEIDLRGHTLEEALYKTDKYLDDAQIAGVSNVTIIHGKGTGVLRRGIEDMLQDRHGVKKYRLGRNDEGGIGVTVVELI